MHYHKIIYDTLHQAVCSNNCHFTWPNCLVQSMHINHAFYINTTTYSTNSSFLIQYITVAPRSFLTLFVCSVRVTCVYYMEKLHTQWVYYTEKLHAQWVYYTRKNYTHCECTTRKNYTHSECTTRKNYMHCASTTWKLYIMQSACSKRRLHSSLWMSLSLYEVFG